MTGEESKKDSVREYASKTRKAIVFTWETLVIIGQELFKTIDEVLDTFEEISEEYSNSKQEENNRKSFGNVNDLNTKKREKEDSSDGFNAFYDHEEVDDVFSINVKNNDSEDEKTSFGGVRSWQ